MKEQKELEKSELEMEVNTLKEKSRVTNRQKKRKIVGSVGAIAAR